MTHRIIRLIVVAVLSCAHPPLGSIHASGDLPGAPSVGCSDHSTAGDARNGFQRNLRQLQPASRKTTLPLYFIENKGQLDSQVAYYVQGRSSSVFFTSQGITIALAEMRTGQPAAQKAALPGFRKTAADADSGLLSPRRWVIKQDFLGANIHASLRGIDPTPATFNYFKGGASEWKTNLRTYAGVSYHDIWPGIDLVYTGESNRLKYEFIIQPGADPDRIRLGYRGARKLRLTKEGRLEVTAAAGSYIDERPISYQQIDGRRVEIATEYALELRAADSEQVCKFQIAEYDRSQALILDPTVLVYAGFIGGNGNDMADGISIAVDSTGNAYLTGNTSSADFPPSVGPDTGFNGDTDAFVVKVNAAGTGLIYAGFIGGTGFDVGHGIAVDSAGNAYITGRTTSSESSFPVSIGPALVFKGGPFASNGDAFVAKINAGGNALVYCGYIGGSAGGVEEGWGIAVDANGQAVVAGNTDSSEVKSFPVTVGPDLTHNGSTDAFIAKIAADGSGLLYCGYLGGSSVDTAWAVALDADGNAYVTGDTLSREVDGFPVRIGPDLTYNGGSTDAYVAKVEASGSRIVYCGYIGGDSLETGWAVDVDKAGAAYVVGRTGSTSTTFPVTIGPDTSFNGGPRDAFIAKVAPSGRGLIYAGYIGGNLDEDASGVRVDGAGNAYVVGYTESSESSFPVLGGPDSTFNGGTTDAFITKVNADGTALVYSGYIGGSNDDAGVAVSVDNSGNVYIIGNTKSSEASGFPVQVGPDISYNGSWDVFVAKITDTGSAADLLVSKSDLPDPATAGSQLTYVVTVTNNGSSAAHAVIVVDSLPAAINFVSGSPSQGSCAYNAAGKTLACQLGTLSAGSAATVNIVVVPTAMGNLVNWVSASSSDPDPDLSNNAAFCTTAVDRQNSYLPLIRKSG